MIMPSQPHDANDVSESCNRQLTASLWHHISPKQTADMSPRLRSTNRAFALVEFSSANTDGTAVRCDALPQIRNAPSVEQVAIRVQLYNGTISVTTPCCISMRYNR
jgi:hypothetical protein